jgi:hypothetical protein
MSDFDMNRPFGYQVGFDLIKEAKQYLEITTTGDRHTFPFACPATTGVAHFATDLIARMVPEIERLRGFESACDNLARKLTAAEKRIEELEDAARATVERQLQKGMYITTDQIDAAWKYSNAKNAVAALTTELCLKELGIVRCGHYQFDTETDEEFTERIKGCESCHGHGWVVEADDATF